MESLKLKIYRKLEGLILENIKTAPHWSDQTRLVMVSREIFSPQLNLEKGKLDRKSK